MSEYEDRPQAVAAEHTKGVLQPPVLYVETWKVFGMGTVDTVSGEESLKVQANLYCTCFSPDHTLTLAHQATVMLPDAAAIRLGQELILHGCSIKNDIGRVAGDSDLAKKTADLVTTRLRQLQAELQEMESNSRRKEEPSVGGTPEEPKA